MLLRIRGSYHSLVVNAPIDPEPALHADDLSAQ